jgi:hypothetical protein
MDILCTGDMVDSISYKTNKGGHFVGGPGQPWYIMNKMWAMGCSWDFKETVALRLTDLEQV